MAEQCLYLSSPAIGVVSDRPYEQARELVYLIASRIDFVLCPVDFLVKPVLIKKTPPAMTKVMIFAEKGDIQFFFGKIVYEFQCDRGQLRPTRLVYEGPVSLGGDASRNQIEKCSFDGPAFAEICNLLAVKQN